MDVKRFSRQIIIDSFGIEGQLLLERSKVLIIGLGGLGTPVATYLALAGVGHLGLFDFDKVEVSNLQRQPLYFEADTGSYKVDVAEKRLKEYNKNISLELYKDIFDLKYKEIFKEYDLVIDCTDNIVTRKIINQASLETGTPFIYGSIDQFTIQIALLNYQNGPCYECLYPQLENSNLLNCLERGILGPIAGIGGVYQALEAIKFLAKMNVLKHKILYIDLWNHKQLKLDLKKHPECICNHYHNQKTFNDKPKLDTTFISITIEDLKKLQDVFIIDLRQNETKNNFYHHYNINDDQVLYVDLKDLPTKFDLLPKEQPIVIVCSSGARAKQAIILLKQLSFENVFFLQFDELLFSEK